MAKIMNLTPGKIVEELDKYIIGQDKAKRAVAIALRNRWRRRKVKGELQNEIMPNNIILIGPTGVGKTEIARRLSKLANAPFTKVEASKFTEVGYVLAFLRPWDPKAVYPEFLSYLIHIVYSRKIVVIKQHYVFESVFKRVEHVLFHKKIFGTRCYG